MLVDDNGMTSAPGLFAGSDIVAGPSLVLAAIRNGKKAAAETESCLPGRGIA